MSNNSELKRRILSEIQRLSEAGRPPGIEVFEKETTFSRWHVHKIWPEWGDAIKEAGFEPNAFGLPQIPRDMLLRCLAELTRELARLPTRGNIIWASNNKQDFPSLATFQRARLSNRNEIARNLNEWIDSSEEFGDIRQFLDSQISSLRTAPSKTVAPDEVCPVVSLSDSFLPPVVSCLSELASNSTAAVSACASRNANISSEFEERVAVAFELLDLYVERLGQGMGRNPDGIAKCLDHHWAVIYDAKVRSSSYRLLTEEDRKFREYIERTGERLREQGIGKFYFAVISSGFAERDLPKAKELVRLTHAKSCVLVEADALASLIEQHIRRPANYAADKIERMFMDTRILRVSDVRIP